MTEPPQTSAPELVREIAERVTEASRVEMEAGTDSGNLKSDPIPRSDAGQQPQNGEATTTAPPPTQVNEAAQGDQQNNTASAPASGNGKDEKESSSSKKKKKSGLRKIIPF